MASAAVTRPSNTAISPYWISRSKKVKHNLLAVDVRVCDLVIKPHNLWSYISIKMAALLPSAYDVSSRIFLYVPLMHNRVQSRIREAA